MTEIEPVMLYLPCTRGARTYGGVPAIGFGLDFGICWVGYMWPGQADISHFRGYIWVISFGVAYYAMRYAVERDPCIFRILQKMFDTVCLGSQTMWAAPRTMPRKARMQVSAI